MKPSGVHSAAIRHHSAVGNRQSAFLWPIAILVLAAGLRLWGLGAKSLWLDEIMTVHKATLSFSGMMDEILKTDAHPPLFQIVQWTWMHLECGMGSVINDALARIPAVIFGVAGVWLAFLIARRLFGRKAAVGAGFLMAVSYFAIFYSQEARLHSMVTALFLGQTYLLLRVLAKRGKAGWGLWSAYGLVGLASLYTYALCALTVGTLAAVYLWQALRRNPQVGRWLTIHVLMALLFLPWVPTLHARTAALEASIRQHHDSVGRPGFAEIGEGIASWGVGPLPWEKRHYAGPLLGLGLTLAAASAALLRKAKRPAKILGALFFIPLVGYLALPMPRVHAYEAKHLIFLQPILLIALCGAFGVAAGSVLDSKAQTRGEYGRTGVRRAAWLRAQVHISAVIVLALVNVVGLSDYYRPGFEKENWRGLASDVDAQLKPGDLVLFNPAYAGYAFEHYSHAGNDKAGAETLLKPGTDFAKEYGRIWLIEDQSAVAKASPLIARALLERGWKGEEGREYAGAVAKVRWVLFVR